MVCVRALCTRTTQSYTPAAVSGCQLSALSAAVSGCQRLSAAAESCQGLGQYQSFLPANSMFLQGYFRFTHLISGKFSGKFLTSPTCHLTMAHPVVQTTSGAGPSTVKEDDKPVASRTRGRKRAAEAKKE